MVFYPNPIRAGTDKVDSLGDGYTINVQWFQAAHDGYANKIAYNIYYSTVKDDVFIEGPKYVSIDGSLQANLIGLIPGQEYFVAVRPIEYDPTFFNLTLLPIAYDNLRFYPHSMLRSNITASSLIIPLLDVEGFPNTGVIQVGVELIQYLSVDNVNQNLIVSGGSSGTPAHLIDQGGGHFYTPAVTNVGQGVINSLAIVPNAPALTENWTIRCIFVQKDSFGNPIPGTGQFLAIGSLSGGLRDGYGNPFIWTANNVLNSNGILSFSIAETAPPFQPGDSFLIKVAGATAGAPGGRGFNGTTPTLHNVDGYDGDGYWSPIIPLTTTGEDLRWDRIFACQSRFEYPSYQFTMKDGYHQVPVDLLNSDYSGADAANVGFPAYDYAGYHRTDPVQLLTGVCVGSYIGGEMGCIDQYGNYNIVRGLSLQDQNLQRQEVLLSVTGRTACLLRRVHTGITCSCYLPSSENPDDRCPLCYGTKFVFGYEQWFDPRRSDGRILVRPGPTPESIKRTEDGLESEFQLDLWTMAVPTIKMRDVLVLFDQNNNEEYRYEVGDVIRNETIVDFQGGQHLKVFRVRKFDPIYQIRIIRDTSDFPEQLNTSIGMALPGIPPHTHTIVVNEKIMSVSQINQTTGVSQGHNHPIVNGQVMEVLGHTHNIILV